MNLLVGGGTRVDAGKTIFAAGLLSHLEASGVSPSGFKPRAGNDYWFDHDDVLHAIDEGRLYGKDARRLAATTSGDPAPEAINPVHRLWLPTPGRSGPLGEPDRSFLVDRVTIESTGTDDRSSAGVGDRLSAERRDRFVVNDTIDIPAPLSDALPLEDALRVDSLEAFNRVMTDLHRPAFERLGRTVATAEPAVVESYSDVALPLTDFEPDAVAVVHPGSVGVYDGSRYYKARTIASGTPHEGKLEERVENVTELVDPVAVIDLPVLSSSERDDPNAVADAYAEAYLSLLDVAQS